MESVNGVIVENLVVRYGDICAVNNVSFHAASGEVTAILGPNGAGKTSVIEVCEGFVKGSSGHVEVLGLHPIRDHDKLTTRMGVMLQGGGIGQNAAVPMNLMPLAKQIHATLGARYMCDFDETQAIGRRYRRQDEIGTPLCVTVDFDSLEDNAVTIRHRDSTEQVRVPIASLLSEVTSILGF